MVAQIAPGNLSSTRRDKVSVLTVDDNHNPSSSGATSGFDDEFTTLANDARKLDEMAMFLQDSVGFRYRNAVFLTDFLGDQLVINARIEVSRVFLEDVRDVEAIDTEDTALFELLGPRPETFRPVDHATRSIHSFDGVV